MRLGKPPARALTVWAGVLAVAASVLVVAAVVYWGLSLASASNSRASSANGPSTSVSSAARRGTASPSPSASPTSTASEPASEPGVIQPTGNPVFSASFTGSGLDPSVWGRCYPYPGDSDGSPSGCTNSGNSEFEWYLPAQDQVYGGALHLVAQKISTAGTARDGSPQTYACRSGIVTSYPGLQFKYGYLQVVAQIPEEPGMWPALWLEAANGQWPPEIDILEHWGVDQESAEFLHPVGQGQLRFRLPPDLIGTAWHTFGLSWTRSQLTWFIDGKEYFVDRIAVPHLPMFFIANLADSENPTTPGVCSGSLNIRSVELWKG
jgi:beta-glucanase (GH16 family)